MVEITGTPLLGKMPIDIPLCASFSYFLGNGIIIMWKLLIKTQKSNFSRNTHINILKSSQYSFISPRSSDFSKKIMRCLSN